MVTHRTEDVLHVGMSRTLIADTTRQDGRGDLSGRRIGCGGKEVDKRLANPQNWCLKYDALNKAGSELL